MPMTSDTKPPSADEIARCICFLKEANYFTIDPIFINGLRAAADALASLQAERAALKAENEKSLKEAQDIVEGALNTRDVWKRELERVQPECDAAIARAEKAEAELRTVDEALARTPALDQPNRYLNIRKAVNFAAKADATIRSRDAQITALREAIIKFPCEPCHGSGKIIKLLENGHPATVDCTFCDGTGTHPRARTALAQSAASEGPPKSKHPWIDATDSAGPLPDKALNSLKSRLVPDGKGNLITLPADTWQGMWKFMHMQKYLAEHHQSAASEGEK